MSTEIVTRTEQLSEYEARIEHGFTAFYDAGDALQKINEERLYQEAGYKTFDDYCFQRWGIKRGRAYQLIESAKIYHNLSTTVDTLPNLSTTVDKLPTSERQVRPLTKLEPEQQPAAWAKAVESANGHHPTGKQVEAVVRACPKEAQTKMPPKISRTSTPTVTRSDFDAGPGIDAEFSSGDDLMADLRRKLEAAGYFVASEAELMSDKCPCCGRPY